MPAVGIFRELSGFCRIPALLGCLVPRGHGVSWSPTIRSQGPALQGGQGLRIFPAPVAGILPSPVRLVVGHSGRPFPAQTPGGCPPGGQQREVRRRRPARHSGLVPRLVALLGGPAGLRPQPGCPAGQDFRRPCRGWWPGEWRRSLWRGRLAASAAGGLSGYSLSFCARMGPGWRRVMVANHQKPGSSARRRPGSSDLPGSRRRAQSGALQGILGGLFRRRLPVDALPAVNGMRFAAGVQLGTLGWFPGWWRSSAARAVLRGLRQPRAGSCCARHRGRCRPSSPGQARMTVSGKRGASFPRAVGGATVGG